MLSQIENSFLKSEAKVKLQLFILPIICIYFYFYFFNKNDLVQSKSSSLNTINSLLTKKFNGSYLSLTKDIEAFCLLEKIKLNSIDYNEKKLLIKGKTSLSKINKLILKLEYINNFSKINSLSIEQIAKKNQYSFQISSEFKKYYIKEKIVSIEIMKKKKVDKFKLKAIISNHVLLNNKWYVLNDKIGKYKIQKIEKNLVVLKYKDKNINLRLSKNE